ncbi:hypothetical protein MASR2M39_14570 [Ignavibacteriales bacterium]
MEDYSDLSPRPLSTGIFVTDEVITSGEIISSEYTTVTDGVTLKIEGKLHYYRQPDYRRCGGVLTLEPGSTLNSFDSASSVYCRDIYANGTDKQSYNKFQPNETK